MNDDLLTPLESETFINDAVSGTATVAANGTISGTASQSDVTFAYDQATNTYTVSTAGRSQSFSAADRDPSQTANGLFGYSKTSGNVTDTLTLTAATTSGNPGFQYVGAGFWQRNTGNTNGTIDAFTYGVATADSAVPRIGTARYEVQLNGVGAWTDAITSAVGTGSLDVDFVGGTLTGIGEMQEFDATTGTPAGAGDWSLSATIAAAANAVNGTFNLYPTSAYSISGPLAGRFYGPTGEEFGASYALTGNDSPSGAGAFVGTILGYRSDDTGLNTSLLTLAADQTFNAYTVAGQYSIDNATGDVTTSEQINYGVDFEYDSSTGLYSVRKSNDPAVASLDTSNSDASLSDDTFSGYSGQDGAIDQLLRLYRVGPSNPELALTYTSFGQFQRQDATVSGTITTEDAWFVYGIHTDASDLPTTGEANYTGIIRGSAVEDGQPVRAVTGTSQFNINFGTSQASGEMQFLIDRGDGSFYDLGTVLLPQGSMQIAGFIPQGYSWRVLTDGNYRELNVAGYFFGPQAAELGGNFSSQYVGEGTSFFGGDMWGVFAATKD